jgi:hypothetical protein
MSTTVGPLRGTAGSNPFLSSGESGANLIFGGESHRSPRIRSFSVPVPDSGSRSRYAPLSLESVTMSMPHSTCLRTDTSTALAIAASSTF